MASHGDHEEPASSDHAPSHQDPDERGERWIPTRYGAAVDSRPCAWCAAEIEVERRPGRPRIYCRHACRQRAYEHRHGFVHQRTVRELPGQATGQRTGGTGYERGITSYRSGAKRKVHAMRTSVRPEGHRRETLCGALAIATPLGRHFSPLDPRACRSCVIAAAKAPLTLGIHPSNELSRLRALIEETAEHRLDPAAALDWLQRYRPEVPPDSSASAASRHDGGMTAA